MTRTATCCCGQLSITLEGEPALNAICHCNDCKKRTGSAFGWSTYFSNAQVKAIAGESRRYALAAQAPQVRHFCPDCGTTLYWTTEMLPGQTGVAGGAFVERPVPAPSASYNGATRCTWFEIPEAFHSQE